MASRPPVPQPPQHIHRARGGVAAPPRPAKLAGVGLPDEDFKL